MTGSLILAAHGSTGSGDRNQPLFDLADQIAQQNRFTMVTPAFLQGEPHLTRVLELLPPGRAAVVPVMTSAGFYLATLPARLNQNPNRQAFELGITPVIGAHESIPHQISQRISNLLTQYRLETSKTTIVVVGHGTRRNPNSSQTTLVLAAKLASLNAGLKIESAFLDQDPCLSDVAMEIETPNTIVIPFLIGRGPHSTIDIPSAFGLSTHLDIEFPIVQPVNPRIPRQQQGICICDLPVGLYPGLVDVCSDLASVHLGMPQLANVT